MASIFPNNQALSGMAILSSVVSENINTSTRDIINNLQVPDR